MGNSALSEITKIGNYAIPAFGAFLTAALAVGGFPASSPNAPAIVVNFALYTASTATVGYFHRLCYLRWSNVQKAEDKKLTDLPRWRILIFLGLHLILLLFLIFFSVSGDALIPFAVLRALRPG